LLLRFDLANINSPQEIQLTNALHQILPFNFNAQTKRLEAQVTLMPGVNIFTLTATNNCGSKTQTLQIEQVACQLPTVQIMNAGTNNTTVQRHVGEWLQFQSKQWVVATQYQPYTRSQRHSHHRYE
jgi:hypothetical protein